jgi:hypothetical protein
MLYETSYKSLHKLLNWLSSNGDAGFDPYDIKGLNNKMLDRMKDVSDLSFINKLYRYFIIELLDLYFPKLTRLIYGVKPKIHATSQGLLFETHLNLYRISNDKKHLKKARSYRQWLIDNRSNKYPEYGWGTPFKWRSGDVIYNIGEPFAVVNAWIGDAFFKYYKINKSVEDLDICISICNFFINRLHISKVDENRVCFSYSAVKPNYINNANLFVAEYLIKIGIESNNNEFIKLGKMATNYSLSTQLKNGALPYFGPEENNPLRIDSYHSGYEIRMLYSIYSLTKDENMLAPIQKYVKYFKDSFIRKSRIRTKPHKQYPLDITSAAEIILLLNRTGDLFNYSKDDFQKILNKIIGDLQTKKGWFIYRIQKPWFKIKIPYIRWGEAWMALALSETLIHNQVKKS